MELRRLEQHHRPRKRAVVAFTVLALVVGGATVAGASSLAVEIFSSGPVSSGVEIAPTVGIPSSNRGDEIQLTASQTPTPTPTPTPTATAATRSGGSSRTGGGGAAPAPAPAPTTVAPPSPPPTPSTSPAALAMADEVRAGVNTRRADNSLAALATSSCATAQAQLRVNQLIAENGFYHLPIESIMTACGVSSASENLALGYLTGLAVADGWMASTEGHREAMLGSWGAMGVACADQDGDWLCAAVFVS